MTMFQLRERGIAAKEKALLRMTEPSSWKLEKQESSVAPEYVWTNPDMDPVPVEKRTWGNDAFITYWFSDLVTISTWTAGSSILTIGRPSFLSFIPTARPLADAQLALTGLTATDAVIITLVASICNAIPTVLNGAIGADLHIPFPVAARASFGYWFSYFAVISRGILAMFWFGVQTANGGRCVTTVSHSRIY